MTENFRRISLESAPRTELHDALGLTGCEVSVNALPAGAAVPFVHRHVKNEEVYGILEGRGELYIVTAKWSSSRRATGSASRPKAAAPSAPPPIRASASSASRRRRGASRVLRTTTASPATKRRPGSESTQNSPSRAHKRRQKLDVGRALREDPASCGRSCTHPYQPACADGLLCLPSVFLLPSSVRAGPIGNFPRTSFLSLALSFRVSYSVDTRSGTRRGVAETRIKKPLRIVTC